MRVLKLSRAPFYRWRRHSVTVTELVEAHRANALFDAHCDDPEFGYRFLRDEADAAGEPMAERTAWRICRDNCWWSTFGKKRGVVGNQPGPPVHDDRVRRDFTAIQANELWLTDISEHPTAEGKLYLCAAGGRVLRADRWLLHRFPDEVSPLGECAGDGGCAPR